VVTSSPGARAVSDELQSTSALEAGVEVEVLVGGTGVFVEVPAAGRGVLVEVLVAGTTVFVSVLVAGTAVLVGDATGDPPKDMAKMWSAEVEGVPRGFAALATGIVRRVAILLGSRGTEVK
jgi:hypothetical protein